MPRVVIRVARTFASIADARFALDRDVTRFYR
jgi:hypothetical protein